MTPQLPCSNNEGEGLMSKNSNRADFRKHGYAGRKALVVEDVRLREKELVRDGYECSRITHGEATGNAGTESTSKLFKGDYNILWISTPNDWRVRTRKAIPLCSQLASWSRRQ